MAKIWKVTWHVFLYLAGLAAVFVYGVVPWFLTSILTTGRYHFPDPNDGKTPRSFSLDFRWVEFHSTDGISLKGWYIPAAAPEGEARGTIVYCHGHNRTRIEMLPEAVFAHGLGYNGLLFDLRHQGQSGGELTTIGYNERLDVLGAVRYLLSQQNPSRPIVLWGVSMGAAAGLMAAADSPDVAAVISDSTFLSFQDVVRHHAKLFLHIPSFPLADEVIYGSAWRAHFWPADFDLRKAVDHINPRPILFIGVEGDRRMPPSIARALHARATSPRKVLVILPGNRHGEGFRTATEAYEQAVTHFLASISPAATGNVALQDERTTRE